MRYTVLPEKTNIYREMDFVICYEENLFMLFRS